MKPLIFLLFISILAVTGCEKDSYKSAGTITGADMAMCACCGGYFIEIESTTYRFEKSELPDNFSFDDLQLPLKVELDWELKTSACTNYNWIKISKIRVKL
jgi:hypothetical protein